jgi:hypothetical protein
MHLVARLTDRLHRTLVRGLSSVGRLGAAIYCHRLLHLSAC